MEKKNRKNSTVINISSFIGWTYETILPALNSEVRKPGLRKSIQSVPHTLLSNW